MKKSEEFAKYTIIKKNKNHIICSTGNPKNLDAPGFPTQFLVMRTDNKHKFKVGDIRIKFHIVPCPEASVLSEQHQDDEGAFSFRPFYLTERGLEHP